MCCVKWTPLWKDNLSTDQSELTSLCHVSVVRMAENYKTEQGLRLLGVYIYLANGMHLTVKPHLH